MRLLLVLLVCTACNGETVVTGGDAARGPGDGGGDPGAVTGDSFAGDALMGGDLFAGDTSAGDSFSGDAFSGDTSPVENSFALCVDGLDNDGDGYFDCQDSSCWDPGPCDTLENSATECGDGYDNDGDGYLDCADFGCDSHAACNPAPETNCSDGLDDDNDGYTDCVDFDCGDDVACTPVRVRIATWNLQSIASGSSAEYAATVDIVRRVSPDILCLQEVESFEGYRLARLADDTQYPELFQGSVSTPMAGGLTNACLSRYPIVDAASLSSDDITGDPLANETGRDIVRVRVQLPNGEVVALFVAHLKSGFNDSDRFRRQVEVLRMTRAVEQNRVSNPSDAIVVMGDFNAEPDDNELGTSFASLPSGLPGSYSLGSDLSLPIVYQPFDPLLDASLTMLEPSHEDDPSELGTRIPSGRRLDYLFTDGLAWVGDEVYDSEADNGVDDPPTGDWLAKQGAPLPDSTGFTAADHRVVFADFDL